jgi:hypothetical protein
LSLILILIPDHQSSVLEDSGRRRSVSMWKKLVPDIRPGDRGSGDQGKGVLRILAMSIKPLLEFEEKG